MNIKKHNFPFNGPGQSFGALQLSGSPFTVGGSLLRHFIFILFF